MINTPIDFGEMIGAPLNAIIQGETIAAQANADFIQTVGFVPDGVTDSFGSFRMISFEFERKSESEQDKTETAIMRVPLLSLIPIPLLQVKNATIEFGLNITDFVSSQTSSGNVQGKSANKEFSFVGVAKPRVKVLPQPIPTKSTTTQDTTTKVDLQMKLNIVQADIPSGLAKLFSAFEAAMGEIKPVTKGVMKILLILSFFITILACNPFFSHHRTLICDKEYKFWELVPRQGVERGYLFTQTDSAFFYIHNIDGVRQLDGKKNKPHKVFLDWELQGDSLRVQNFTHYIVKLTPDTMILRYLNRSFEYNFDTLVVQYDTLVPSKNQKMP